MTDVISPSGAPAAATSTFSGQPLSLPGWAAAQARDALARERLIAQARDTDAARQLQRCFVGWRGVFDHLTWRALVRPAANEPVDVNDDDMWASRDEHADAVLRRYGLSKLSAGRLTIAAVRALIDGQRTADQAAGRDWSKLTVPAGRLDQPLGRAHASLPIDLEDPSVYINRGAQRRALAGRLGLDCDSADDLSRWALAYPDQFNADDLRCWRIGSRSWPALVDEQLDTVERLRRPVGLFLAPAFAAGGWQLAPVLSLDAIRLVEALGGQVDRDLSAATVPFERVSALLERINVRVLHAGPEECLDSAGQLAQELRGSWASTSARVLRRTSATGGGDCSSRLSYCASDGAQTAELRLRVVTFPARGFSQRRLGARPLTELRHGQASAVMELGEAVQTAVER